MALINWYPGHMEKSKRLIQEQLKIIDVVIEILDARIPLSSQNPLIKTLIKQKLKILVLNKADLAKKEELKKWIEFFKIKKITALAINSQNGQGIKNLLNIIKIIAKPILEKNIEKMGKSRPIRLMILGIPNVGKSSLINKISKQNRAKIGNKPGITRGNQWIRLGNNLELLDTPGMLYPKISDSEIGIKLAITGAIKEEILPLTEIGEWLLNYLIKNNYSELKQRYKLEKNFENLIDLLNEIGNKRGCKLKNEKINYSQVWKIIIHEFRAGYLGKIILDDLNI